MKLVTVPEMPAVYYTARGWYPATGHPMQEKLESPGLEKVAKDLWGG